ncbi:hypothetical protein PDJAM_G00162060 [Pangasius djambal]|uniref:Uncharacterized protein n=1 Tax=Pangasius djambal TaxID=1691987 RepID=A0ACC5ZJI3_9TELE|nr:hypothetical protein [Pangasius djambal]
MSAQAQMRAMLDQLMGTGRDGDTMRQRIKFTDERVCKSHLLESCPHDILSGTRMDLGECLKVHDLALRADYEIASKHQEYFFELDAAEHLQSFIADCDRRTELAKKRLAETQEEISAEVAAKDIYRNSMPASSFQQQKLRVCEVCSAYLGLHDNDRRLADHFGGKLHLGFIEIREKLEKLRVRTRTPPPPCSQICSIRRHTDGGSSSSHRSRRHRSSHSRDRDRERKHRHKDRHRSRSHSHRRKKKRSSHTRERERSLSQERWREYGGEDRWREDSRRDVEREPGERERSISSPEMGRLRGRERSVSVERENRSSSEERESGEI